MRSSWIMGWALNPLTSILIKREDTQGKRPCEDGGRDSSDEVTGKECHEPPDTGRQEGTSPGAFGVSAAMPTL